MTRQMRLKSDFWSGTKTGRRLKAGTEVIVERRELGDKRIYVVLDGNAETIINRDQLAEVGQEIVAETPGDLFGIEERFDAR